MTPRQHCFTLEYLKDLNATQAAARAGYAHPSCLRGCHRATAIRACLQPNRGRQAGPLQSAWEHFLRWLPWCRSND